MARGRWQSRLVGLVMASNVGCGNAIDLAASPRIEVVQTRDALTFIRGSERYEHGYFGAGLHAAVAGVPDAEEHAEAHSRLLVGGLLLELGGAVMAGAALASAVSSEESPEALDTSLLLVGGALALSLTSDVLYAHSEPHVLQAVNAYNDEVRAAREKKGHDRPAPSEGTSMLQR